MHSVRIEHDQHATIVLAAGELDAFVAPDLLAAFDELRGEDGVIADLTRVSFLDSTALGVIVRRTRELVESGTRVRVVLPAGAARRIFEITGLDRVLPVVPTRMAALEELDVRLRPERGA